MITFHVLTLFPESFPSILNVGLIGKAFQKKLFEVNKINIRDYSELSANSVDDKPFSGGAGMVLRPDIISSAIEKNFSSSDIKNFKKICFSAKGKSLTQSYLEENKDQTNFILLNGRYEGIDQRVIDYYDFEELSVSDVVLNGGEVASLLFMESFIRLQPEVLGNQDTHLKESFYDDLLEHDQFTRPNPWIGPDNQPYDVPPILTNGHHGEIEAWKKQNALENTQKNRPDLMKNYLKKSKNE